MNNDFSRMNIIRDALHNFDLRSGATSEKRQGILIGMVSVLMAQGMEFNTALRLCKLNFPSHYDQNGIPSAWKDDFDQIKVDFNLNINFRR